MELCFVNYVVTWVASTSLLVGVAWVMVGGALTSLLVGLPWLLPDGTLFCYAVVSVASAG